MQRIRTSYNFDPPVKAYIETIGFGLVPCVVLSASRDEYSRPRLRLRVTATRGAYKRGELLNWSGRYVVPRDRVHRRGGHVWVAPYLWPTE